MRVTYCEPTHDDLDHIAHRLRPADLLEVVALSGTRPQVALRSLPVITDQTWVARLDDEPVACFGYTGFVNTASIYMVGTKKLVMKRSLLLIELRSVVSEFAGTFPVLWNYVSEHNDQHIRWLEALGFTIRRDQPVYFNGFKFFPFQGVSDVLRC